MKIALVGDLGFFGKFSLKKNKKLFEYFKEISEVLNQYDLVIGNLETPFCENLKEKGSKSAYISSESINVELLKYLNISLVNLSNNHIYDYGVEGVHQTVEILEKNNIEYFGINNKQIFKEIDKNKLAFSGYCCYSTNALGYYNDKTGKGISILKGIEIEQNLQSNFENGFLNIASIHCGEEHINYPNYDHIELARKLAKKVPYIYYGHHPHVIQGIERYNEALLAYSLGNFCFDDVYTSKSQRPLIKQSENNKKSFILEIEIEENIIKNYKVIPIYTNVDTMEIGSLIIKNEILEYSNALKEDKEIYIKRRETLLTDYIKKRKSKRDLAWYIKRINLRSILIILDLRFNREKYNRFIRKYIQSR